MSFSSRRTPWKAPPLERPKPTKSCFFNKIRLGNYVRLDGADFSDFSNRWDPQKASGAAESPKSWFLESIWIRSYVSLDGADIFIFRAACVQNRLQICPKSVQNRIRHLAEISFWSVRNRFWTDFGRMLAAFLAIFHWILISLRKLMLVGFGTIFDYLLLITYYLLRITYYLLLFSY